MPFTRSTTLVCFLALAAVPALPAQSAKSVSLAVTVGAECVVGTSSPSAVSVDHGKNASETVGFNYKVRTSASRGAGQITLFLTGTVPGNDTNAGTVDFQTQLAGQGAPVSGSIPVADALRTGIVIAQFGPQTGSSRAGTAGSVRYSFNPPRVKPLQSSLAIRCQ
jgi:hypothetical protein